MEKSTDSYINLVLNCNDIVKNFGEKKALDSISFSVTQGECFTLLGPVGSGKSTTLKIIYGQMNPTSGDLFVLNLNAKVSQSAIKQRLGVIPQDNGLDAELTVYENLKTFCWYYDIKPAIAKQRMADLIEELKLSEYLHSTLDQLNAGLRKRVAIARALLHRPEILIFDEPTVGLNAQMRQWVWDYIRPFKKQNRSIIMTTQSVIEAEALSDRVAIMDKGVILAIGTPKDLIFDKVGTEVLEFSVKPAELNYYLEKYRQQGMVARAFGDNRIMLCFKKAEDTKKIVQTILSDEIIIRKPTLNDVFLALTGTSIREEEV